MVKKVIVIGSGFAGLSAASFMAKAGWQVTVLEKQSGPGGRARQLQQAGFTFDMGPSWYWMPDVFERYFASFGKEVKQYYQLQRLDPSYRIYWEQSFTDLPASLYEFKKLIDTWEPGAAAKLDRFLKEAAYKYKTGMQKLVYKPGQSVTEFLDADVLKGLFRLDLFTSIKTHIHKYFQHPQIRQMLEFPILFLGALPENTPALYSLMNYADIVGGTWYPQGGMYSIVHGMHHLALSLGVEFHFNENVTHIEVEAGAAKKVRTQQHTYEADVVIGSADYHFIESSLLQPEYRTYTPEYWEQRLLAPSSLLYYVGLNKRLEKIRHHMLFFDAPFDQHAQQIYLRKQWPDHPLFYVCAPSVTDDTVAPPGCENLFFLIPVAAGLTGDDEALRNRYFDAIIRRFEERIGQSIAGNIVFRQSFGNSNFVDEYNSFKGNAYGLANTLRQTALLKPSCRSRKVPNLFYAGQLTVPGPGVPPSLISGEVVAKEVLKYYSR
ncbi:phytoene desaturase family protein [Paraflavitalea sp. CAU 1676]|uniref:phytoene desaturase family protein n=1 Tax=Paraflavitalea sp. CAU 1676 TaxID=3032598 RepID=UPI0023DCD0F2|nr:phytoene desaturase family protein [Paraflavitalea sp. CAU 1676]MDF2187157.1 phytoene desaturase family protein [Paraflavitalea sp. CAU 1676]